MMSVYLDASVLVSLFVTDRNTARARAFLFSRSPVLIVSDFASAEFASALNRRVRLGEILPDQSGSIFSALDRWIVREALRIETTASDVKQAQSFLRQLDLPLRTPDALNIAIADRVKAKLSSFDKRMADCARRLGIEVVEL